MNEHYVVGTVTEREMETKKLLRVSFKIIRKPGYRDRTGAWFPGQVESMAHLAELAAVYDLTESEAEDLMLEIGAKLSALRKERNGH